MATTIHGGVPFAETYYVSSDRLRKYGSTVSWSLLFKRPAPGLVPLTLFPVTMIGLDSNSVERANYRALKDYYGERVIEVCFFASAKLGFIGRDDSTELGETARGLAHEDPLFDEDYYEWPEAEDDDL